MICNFVKAVLFLQLVSTACALNILVIFPVASRSHWILGEGYVKELTNAGHNVTIVTVYPTGTSTHLRREIDVSYVKGHIENSNFFDLGTLIKTKASLGRQAAFFSEKMLEFNQDLIRNETMINFINDKSENFDVIVAEWFYSHFIITLGQVFQCPVVIAPSTEFHGLVLELMDHIKSPMTILNIQSMLSIPLKNIFERASQFIFWSKLTWFRWYIQTPGEEQLYEDIIKPATLARGANPIPEYDVAKREVAMALYNSHPSVGLATSLPQNVKPIGGYHIVRPTPALPKDLQSLMDSSSEGVIYFSMGSVLQGSSFPAEMKEGLLKIFARFKQTVIWKYDGELHYVSSNVHAMKWLPQTSVLAHPNIRMFITHGGLLSALEAVHFGVPLIGIPIFGDQFVNTGIAARKGYAIQLDADSLIEKLEDAINSILTNSRETAKLLSSYYHDRIRSPGEELVFWVEHAARTKGAKYLRATTRDIPLYQLLCLDLLASLLVLLLISYYLLRLCFKNRSVEKIKNN